MIIEGVSGKYGKFANNTEKHGQDKFASGWTLPLEFNLTGEQFEEAFGQKYFSRAFFAEKKDAKYSAWKDFLKFPLPVALEYENCSFALTFVGGKEVSWDSGDGKKERGVDIDKIEFEVIDNDTITVWCNAYVHPNASQKKLLDEFQHSGVTVDISGGEIASKMKRKQGELFDGKGAEEGGNAAAKDAEGEGAGFAAAAKAQVDAYRNGKRAKGEKDDEDSASTH
jgi:hypothetical protein